KEAAACSTAEPPLETLPLNASTPRSHGTPRPTDRPASASPSGPSFAASEANAVLQDLAKFVWNGTSPSEKSLSFLKLRPSTVKVRGQATTSSARIAPRSSSPIAETILNVEPGGTWAVSARDRKSVVQGKSVGSG